MRDNRDAIDFAKDPVRRVFGRMFFPTLIGMVSMVVLNITDGAFVGHGVSSDALAAVNIVAPLFLISGGVGLMFGIGSSVVASIHLSRNNPHAANLNITQGIGASFMTGIVLMLLITLFPLETCYLFGCTDRLVPLACSYLKWIAILMPFNMTGMTGMFAVRLDGHPRFAMTMNCAMAMLNILLDYILIFPCQMGLEGAAIATTTAFSLGNIPLMWFLITKTHTIHLRRIKMTRTSMTLTLRNLRYQSKIGFSAFAGDIAIASVIIMGNYEFARYLGEDGVAAYSVACYCLPIVFMMGNAIVQSIQPVISFAHGQNNQARLRQALLIALITATLTGALGMLLMISGAGHIATVFLPPHCNAHALCSDGLPLFSSSFLFIALNIVFIGYLQSTEAATKASLYTLLRGFVFAIPAFMLLPLAFGGEGLWSALPLAEALTLVVIAIQYLVTRF